MKVIYIPGFWDSADKFSTLAEVFQENNLDYKILNYSDYKKHGKIFNRDTFIKLLSEFDDNEFKDSILISYSMGASFLYDYLALTDIKPAKVIFINPLLENVGNPLISSYYRVLDMFKQKQLFEAISSANKGLFPLMDVAFFQQKYNKEIDFGEKLNLDVTFVWSDKDLICPIRKYEHYKNYFGKTELVTVPDHHHNWLVYKEPVVEFLMPQVMQF